MKPTPLTDLVRKKRPNTEHIGAKVPSPLFWAVDKVRKEKGHTWSSILIAGVKMYAIENGVEFDNIEAE